jgi:hypothetical protein
MAGYGSIKALASEIKTFVVLPPRRMAERLSLVLPCSKGSQAVGGLSGAGAVEDVELRFRKKLSAMMSVKPAPHATTAGTSHGCQSSGTELRENCANIIRLSVTDNAGIERTRVRSQRKPSIADEVEQMAEDTPRRRRP